jgi:glycosyltransferase involved in cell wall biosynthesis
MKIDQPISCIIPAFNEAGYIDKVLDVVDKIDWIDEIIVVDDASSDRTPDVVKAHKKIKLVVHQQNKGKGAALATGAKTAKHDLLLFLDSDLVGLKAEHILKILAPIIFTKEADLVLGIFALKHMREHTSTKIANWSVPAITGQRAIWRKSLPPMERIEKSRYGVDLLITRHIPRPRRAVIELDGLAQVKKEQKSNDFVEIVKSRFRMYKEVLKILKEEKK